MSPIPEKMIESRNVATVVIFPLTEILREIKDFSVTQILHNINICYRMGSEFGLFVRYQKLKKCIKIKIQSLL